MLTIVVPSRTDALLSSLLTSLATSSPAGGYEVVIADNGLSPGMRARYPAAKFVDIPDPFHFARAVNHAVAQAHPQSDLVIVNDDLVIDSENFVIWMQRALFLAKVQGFGVISPVTRGGVGNVDQNIDPQTRGIVITREPVCFVAVGIPRPVWNTLGGLDEGFPGYGFEDTDFSRRVVVEGWMLGVTGAAGVRHGSEGLLHGVTFNRLFGTEQRNRMFLAARSAYEAKWGCGPMLGSYAISGPAKPRPIPLDWLPALATKPSGMPPLSFDRHLPTGLGDRLSVLLCTAAYGYLLETTVHAHWLSFDGDGPANRQYGLAEMLATGFRFPPRLQVSDDLPAFREAWSPSAEKNAWQLDWQHGELPAGEAFDGVPQLAFRTLRLQGAGAPVEIDAKAYLAAYRAACEGLRLPPLWPALSGLQYTVLHFRGDDNNPHEPEDFSTGEALAAIYAKGLGPVVLVSDDHAAAERWLKAYPEILSARAWTAGQSNVVSALRDISILFHAVAIIQHADYGWSAYSSFAAMARRIPLLCTWKKPGFHRLDLFAAEGGRPQELFKHDELEAFLQAAEAKQHQARIAEESLGSHSAR